MEEREAFPKRPREEAEGGEAAAEAKRRHHHHYHQHSQQQRPAYHHILSSLLEEEGAAAGGVEDEEGEISSLMSALQQELSSFSSDGLSPPSAALHSGQQAEAGSTEEEGCDAEGVMRRLLEASDDDLGIPPTGELEGEEPAATAGQEETVRCGDRGEDKCGLLGLLAAGPGLWGDNLDMDAIVPGYCSYDYYALLQPDLF